MLILNIINRMELSGLKNLYHKIIHNKTLVNGSLFSLSSFLGQGIGFMLLILLANYILPAEYGKLSLFNTAVMFGGIVIAFSSRGYTGVTYFKKDTNEFKKDFTATIILGIISIMLLAIPVLVCGDRLGYKLELSERLLWYLLIISFFSFTFQLQQDYLRIKEKVISYGLYNCGFSILNFILTFYLVVYLNQSWIGRVNALLICTGIAGLLSIIFFLKNDMFRWDMSKKRYQEILAWSIPMIPHTATVWIRQGLDRYIINYFYTTYEVGVFSFALNLSNIIIMIGTAFNSTNSVTQFQILSDKKLANEQKFQELTHQMQLMTYVYCIATIIVIFFSSVLVHFFLPKYNNSIPYMWLLALSGLGNCIYFIYCNYLFYYNKTKLLMYITFGTSVLHLLLSLLSTRYSLYCTAMVYVLMMSLMALIVMRVAKRLIRINITQ